jgi:hypothetical protein
VRKGGGAFIPTALFNMKIHGTVKRNAKTKVTGIRRFGVCAFALCLTAMCISGCGTTSTSRNNWAYVGADAALEFPRPPAPTKNDTAEIRLQRYVELLDAQHRRLLEALENARNSCIHETGDSGSRHFWTGYDKAFLACMSARGWSRGPTNPL